MFCVLSLCSCSTYSSTRTDDEQSVFSGKKPKIDSDSIEIEFDGPAQPKYLNSVKGHDEKEKITGNFTGLGIDTLYIDDEVVVEDEDGCYYYVKSNNPEIPTIQIYGAYCPSLVFEGDVDGDGKDEWGTLSTWMNSQWRLYSIYNYDNKTKKWRYLYDDEGGLDQLLMNDLVEVKRT